MRKRLKEDFQLPAAGYNLYWNDKKIPVYYSDKVDLRFWVNMVNNAIPEYVKKQGYAVEFALGIRGLYIFNDSGDELKITLSFDDSNNSKPKHGIVYISHGDEIDSKEFHTYKELVEAIAECFDRYIATGHIEKIKEQSEADQEKVKTLKLMHGIMQGMNNEDAYYSWIMTGVPDGATEEDYIDIALDEDNFDDVVNVFNRVFKRYAKDGLYKPSAEEAQFAKDKCKELGISDIEILGESMKRMSKKRLKENVQQNKFDIGPDVVVWYFFPKLEDEDIWIAQRSYDLKYARKDSDEDTTVLYGRYADLEEYASDYLDYQLVDGYLVDEDGDEVGLMESLNESAFPPKAKKEISDWWKEVEAWNKKKKEYNIENDYDDVQGMHTAMWDMLSELKNKDKDLYEKGRKIYNKYSDVPIKKKKVKESMNKKKLNEFMWNSRSGYDPKEWEQEDIELHQSIDWQGRNYMEYEVPEDSFISTAVCYRSDAEPEYKQVEFHKFLRANPIYPPYYKPAEKPFMGVVGPMFDGRSKGKYGIHDRYEDQRTYDMLSEDLEDEFDDDILDDEGAKTVIGMDDNKYAKSSSKSVRDSDGFMTDYTAWIDLDNIGHVIFVFGDNDWYDPSNTSPDWECDSAEEAQEWFNSYEGFDDEEDFD